MSRSTGLPHLRPATPPISRRSMRVRKRSLAARADRHYRITKETMERGKRVATRVAEVSADHRREEIARMLAGSEITEEARAAAERLIRPAEPVPRRRGV